jgi:bifunctional non-homologous end joining protein LigD
LFDEPLPKWIKPCLPTLVDKPLVGPHWVHETKWDGNRVSAYVADGKAVIPTRNGHDWTARFPAIGRAATALMARSAVIDGEAVILDDRGRSSFAELQADLVRHGSHRAVLYAFDCCS